MIVRTNSERRKENALFRKKKETQTAYLYHFCSQRNECSTLFVSSSCPRHAIYLTTMTFFPRVVVSSYLLSKPASICGKMKDVSENIYLLK